jgi:hypothetical protein
LLKIKYFGKTNNKEKNNIASKKRKKKEYGVEIILFFWDIWCFRILQSE